MNLRRIAAILILGILCGSATTFSYTPSANRGFAPCIPKPYPVAIDYSRLPDSLQQVFKDFVDDMNYRVIDEIYLRFCMYIDSLIDTLDAADQTCYVYMDSTTGCTLDTLQALFAGIVVRDINQTLPASVILYEDNAAGSNWVSITVARNTDTLELEQNYQLVLPRDDGNLNESRHGPGGGSLRGMWRNNVTANSELLTDGKGDLYWVDRNWFPGRIFVDTIYADSNSDVPLANGDIVINAQEVHLVSDTNETHGDWPATTTGPPKLHLHEFGGGGATKDVTLYANTAGMKANWDLQLPDTGNPYYAGILHFNNGVALSPTWAPYDDEFIIRGVDTLSCNKTRDTINVLESGDFPTAVEGGYNRNFSVPFNLRNHYQVIVEWTRFSGDSAMGTKAGWAYPLGCPNVDDPRYDSLWLCPDHILGNGRPSNLTDSTFVINRPLYGCDTTLVVHWVAIGRLKNYKGEGQ